MADNKKNLKYFMRSMEPEVVTAPGLDSIRDENGEIIPFEIKVLSQEEINKISLVAYKRNDIGNVFWNTIGWTRQVDMHYYDFILNQENITAFIKEG